MQYSVYRLFFEQQILIQLVKKFLQFEESTGLMTEAIYSFEVLAPTYLPS